MDLLVDTGVLLRILDRRDARHPAAVAALRHLRLRGHRLATATQNLREFWNATTRPPGARGGYGRSPQQARLRLAAPERMFDILGESRTSHERWRTLCIDLQISGKQVHDANLAALAFENGLAAVLTFNGSDFQRFSPLVVLSPEDALLIP